MLVVLILGVALILFGGLILIKFPERPGGKIAWAGMEVSSVGAGMPLIIVGVACAVFAASRVDFNTSGTNGSPPTPDPRPPVEDCSGKAFHEIAPERVKGLEEGSLDIEIIGSQQTKEEPFGIRFTDSGRPVGTIAVRFFMESQLFKISALLDSACQPVEEFRNASRGGDGRVLQNWDTLEFRLGDTLYALDLEYGSGHVDADFRRIAR